MFPFRHLFHLTCSNLQSTLKFRYKLKSLPQVQLKLEFQNIDDLWHTETAYSLTIKDGPEQLILTRKTFVQTSLWQLFQNQEFSEFQFPIWTNLRSTSQFPVGVMTIIWKQEHRSKLYKNNLNMCNKWKSCRPYKFNYMESFSNLII